ncbi:acyl-CoA dehydratase activase-related protein [Dendrosporobacter sp. 1207_IL3150]|uniref:acyl-CoA dehydratase activase-related protein n=1 Tax=Dendrosporobacter sp. 1207_IL3150 TaxID=3084054 RepID=UPI002FDABA56
MQIHVGIPRALLYHEYGTLWTEFFRNIGVQATVSDETNKNMLDRGTSLAIDESCLPLKVYLGHVDSLLDKCTHIFVPRIAQYNRNFYLCAKFAGLPDIVRNTFGLSTKQLIAPNIESTSPDNSVKCAYSTCKALGKSPLVGHFAYKNALKEWKSGFFNISNESKNPKIALIGHSYLLQDDFFSREIIGTLNAQGVAVITSNQVASKVLYSEAKVFEPDIYWQLSAKIAGAANYFCRQPDIAGIVIVSSFCCGPDSLVNEYIQHHVLQKNNKPYIILNVDEHSGSAGLITRIEAFWDLVARRTKA